MACAGDGLRLVAVGAVLFSGMWSAPGFACEDGHWIDSVTSDGRIIVLEDGSVWEVDLLDRIDAMLWLPTSDIVACDDNNTDDDEVVSAIQIR
jgi:hypothetical protein